MRRPALVAAGCLLAASASLVGPAPAYAAGAPNVLPAVQQWIPGEGSYTFGPGSRIVVDDAYAGQLADPAATFADDLRSVAGVSVAVVTGTAQAVLDGDLYFTLGSTDTELGDEGYRLEVGPKTTASARTADGAFEASCTLVQLIHQSRTIPGGTVRDWPRYRERGLMVDNGRKYYTTRWLASHIRDRSYLKMNVFHWHLCDDQGFRIESSTHPEVVSMPHYTKQEIGDLLALARRYHVTVVPEIDMPAHMGALLANHPELKLVSASGAVNHSKIDLSKPAVYTFAADLVNEYLPLFPGAVWHVGADEYLTPDEYANYPQLQQYARTRYGAGASGPDTYLGFINYVDDLVKAQGHRLRIWNDGLWGGAKVSVNTDIEVEHWADAGMSPDQLAGRGQQILNANGDYLYYVLGTGWKPDPAAMYSSFRPGLFANARTLAEGDSQLRGAELAIWADAPYAESEGRVASGVSPALRVLAQLDWGSPKPATNYSDFSVLADAVGHTPGYSVDFRGRQLAVAANADGRLEAFALRSNGAVHTTWQTGVNGAWSGWLSLGGRDVRAPVVGANLDGRLELFVVGGDGVLCHKWQTSPNGTWGDWRSAGGTALSEDLVVARNADGRLQVFVVGGDGSLYTTWQSSPNGTWSNWQNLN